MQRIMRLPWHALSRTEIRLRKVFRKYPLDSTVGGLKGRPPAGVGDLYSAQVLRQRKRDGEWKDLSEAEQRWLIIDKVRHPELHGEGELGPNGVGR